MTDIRDPDLEAERRRMEAFGAGESGTYPEPEDRGAATPSPVADVEYVEDLIRPGRIVVVAAEEGTGKSYAINGELAIRVAVAGGSFAGTWPILQTGPVLILSEMHADDDYAREATVLGSLGLERSALVGRYYRLPLMSAAGGPPALTVPGWCSWITAWLRERQAVLLVVDTATGATQVDPWGQAIQSVFGQLRAMLSDYPQLAIVLVVHLKKPSGRGGRSLSDVMGEWGRWNDVTVLMENDGASLDRAKISVRKRVRLERRVVATKLGGLLVEPLDLSESAASKVPADKVVSAVADHPGIGYLELGKAIGVSKATAARYVKALADRIDSSPTGPKSAMRLFVADAAPKVTASPRQIESPVGDAVRDAVSATEVAIDRVTASPPYKGDVVRDAVAVAAHEPIAAAHVKDCRDFRAHQSHHYQGRDGWRCSECEGEDAIRSSMSMIIGPAS